MHKVMNSSTKGSKTMNAMTSDIFIHAPQQSRTHNVSQPVAIVDHGILKFSLFCEILFEDFYFFDKKFHNRDLLGIKYQNTFLWYFTVILGDQPPPPPASNIQKPC